MIRGKSRSASAQTASPVKSRLFGFVSPCFRWAWAHGDWGRVIVTVPALGRPEVSRWDLTRHWLSSLPYSPETGADRALMLWGEGRKWLHIFFASSKHLSRWQWVSCSSTAHANSSAVTSKFGNAQKLFFCITLNLFWYDLVWGLCVLQQMRGKLCRMTAGECWVEHQRRTVTRGSKLKKIPQSDTENCQQEAESSEWNGFKQTERKTRLFCSLESSQQHLEGRNV